MAKLVNVFSVAKRFNVHVDTARRWAREGRIPSIRPTSRTLRFNLEAVEKALSRPALRRHRTPTAKSRVNDE